MSKTLTDNLLARLVNEFDFDINEDKYNDLINSISLNLNDKQGFLYQFKDDVNAKAQILALLNYLVESTGNYADNSFSLLDKFPATTQIITNPVLSNKKTFLWYEKSLETKIEEMLYFLFVILLLSFSLTLPFYALFHLTNRIFESIERLCFAEGSIQALVHLSFTLAGGAASGFLFSSFLLVPLTSLFLTLGLANPAVLAIVGMVAVSIVGAALSSYLFDLCKDAIFTLVYKDSLDPLEPVRYGLTAEDEKYLRAKGLEPLNVKVALAAQHKLKPKFSSFFSRVFTLEGAHEQVILKDIRELKRGEITAYNLGDSSEAELSLDLELRPT